jgi:hypothetical protein
MKNKELQKKLDEELSSIAGELKNKQFHEYEKLKENPKTQNKNVFGKDFQFSSWSEPVVDGEENQLAILVDTWDKKLFWSNRFMKGFIVNPEGFVREINDEELWKYD